ncbi:MAG: orotidine-5'-phosphate decarboxylase [Phycisphaerales bacterium]
MNTTPLAADPPSHAVEAAHPADRLLTAIEAIGAPACVGLDPVWSKLPHAVRRDSASEVDGIRRFGLGVVEAIAGRVPAIKVQSACFERYGAAGFDALVAVMSAAKRHGLVAILDAKRGDIGISAAHYAEAAQGFGADWTTVNGYFGPDGLAPFRQGRGAFVLVRTSNPDGDLVQGLRLADGRTVAEAVGEMVATAGDSSIGDCGFSDLGAVVGATKPKDAAALRERMPRQIFLVPGFGAQGGSADDVRACFDASGRGAIVTASRSVIYAFEPESEGWPEQVSEAACRLGEELRSALGSSA